MSRPGWIHGSTVDPETRAVRYLSPSSLQLADDSTEKGCLRKWWYAYVKGIKEPPTWQQQAGTNDHACVERYLETGERVFSPRVAKGVHMLPPPGPHLEIEHDMVPTLWEGQENCEGCFWLRSTFDGGGNGPKHTCKQVSGLALAPLLAAGIPVVGRIDLMHDLAFNYGGGDVEDLQDPPGTVEVFDHKFTKNLDYALKGPDMLRNIQMVAYGEYVFRTVPEVRQVRLSHGYYPTNGNARKATIRTGREPLSAYWSEHVEPLARSIAAAALETNPDNVRANTKACKAFGRACIHAEYCGAGMEKGLQAHVGATAAQALINSLKKPKDPDMALPGKGLLAHLQKPADTAARQAELAKLKEEEKKAILPDGFADLLADIESYGKGMPQITGAAAKAYATCKGYAPAPGGYTGTGDLAKAAISEVEEYATLLSELTAAFGPPVKAAQSVAHNVPVGLLPDDAPDDVPAAVAAPSPPQETGTPAPEPKPKATRKKASAPDPQPQSQPEAKATVTESALPDKPPGTVLTVTNDTQVNLLVDVTIEGTRFNDFAAMVDALVLEMAKRFDLDDVRTAPAKDASGKDHPLAFGKWKGILTAAIREVEIPAGTYYIDARGSEVYEEAVQALRQVVRRTGGYYIRGAR